MLFLALNLKTMKMKLTLLIITVVFAVSCASSVKDNNETDQKNMKTNWQDYNLNSKVKSLDEIRYFANMPMDSEESVKYRQYIEFSQTGLYIEKSFFASRDSLIYTEEYQYNDEYVLQRIRRTNIYNTCYGICNFSYDDDGSIDMMSEYNCEDALQYNIKITCDDENRIVEMNYVRPGEKDSFVTITKKYDSDGNVSEISNMDVHNNSHIVKKFEYDKDGNKIVEETYNRGEELLTTQSFEYEFDENKNWILCYEKNEDNEVFVIKRNLEYFD
jgi:hypothetical protein